MRTNTIFVLVISAFCLWTVPMASVNAAGTVDKDITYCTIDGVELKLDLHHPTTAVTKPAPLIVWVHGGGWSKGDKTAVWGGDLIPAHGYMVASLNYRLAPAYKFPAMIIDVKCALRFLKANAGQYGIDANRIGLIGGSAGGHLVSLMGVTTVQDDQKNQWLSGQWTDQTDTVQAVVDLYGPADLGAYPSIAKHTSVTNGGVFNFTGPNDPNIALASPISYVSANARVIPPFLIMQGNKDLLVPLSQSQEFYQKLSDAGAQAQLVIVTNAGHGFVPASAGATISPSRSEIEQQVLAFFDRTLLSSAPPSTTPAATATAP